MATQEKLLKSLDHLKTLSNSNPTTDSHIKKREKILHCNIVADAMCNSTVKIAPNFSNLLSYSIETLLEICNDKESDVRMIADESLNRIIRSNNSYLGKVQIELHKQIKKNGADKIVRAALARFAELAHVIRPHKGKPYVVNLIPCLVKIAERNEEILHDTLNSSLPKIMDSLGSFTTDNDIKNMLKVFLNNISNSSAVIRRNAASCILTICCKCRKPHVFVPYVLNNLIDKIVPIQENHTTSIILGVLGTLRSILPHVKDSQGYKEIQGSFGVVRGTYETPLAVDRLIQVYELCLHFISHSDHNIINAALETLNILLQYAPTELQEVLLSPNGITRSRILAPDSTTKLKYRSLSQTSVATTMLSTDENLLVETEIMESLRPDIDKWIDESKLSVMNITFAKTSEMKNAANEVIVENITKLDDVASEDRENCDYSNIVIGSLNADEVDMVSVRSESIVENLDKLVISENSSEKSIPPTVEEGSLSTGCGDVLYQEVDVGDYRNSSIPLIYCCRYIVRSHLLTGYPNNTIPDKTTKVSVKSLTMSCLASILQLYPDVFLMYLDRNHTSAKKEAGAKIDRNTLLKQPISDVLIFKDHSDPQLRGLVSTIIGNFVKSVLVKSGGNYEKWISNNCMVENEDMYELRKLLCILKQGLEDESSTCSRLSLSSISVCLQQISECNNSKVVFPILNTLPHLVGNPYWLVKVKLTEAISHINFITTNYIVGNNDFQNKVLHNILYKLLQDDDHRVRTSAAKTLVRIIPSLYYPEDHGNQNAIAVKAFMFRNKYYTHIFKMSTDPFEKPTILTNTTVFPYTEIGKTKCNIIEMALSRIVTYLSRGLVCSKSIHFTYGCAEALSLLLEEYPSTLYPSSWCCHRNYSVTNEGSSILQRTISTSSDNSPVHVNHFSSSAGLLRTCISLLNTSTISYDLNCHIILLKITGNIFSGVAFKNMKASEDFNAEVGVTPLWNMFTDSSLSDAAEQILNHVVKILNIFSHILDETVPTVPQNKPSLPNLPAAATNLSPLKRRKSDLSDKLRVMSPGKEKDDKKFESAKISAMGFFANIPHYMKIYDLLKTAYSNYKTTLDSEASEKFLCFLKTTIETLSQVLEVGSIVELGRIAEEILHYLRATVILKPTATVECVQQLLKCLFGTNLTSNSNEFDTFKLHKMDNEETGDTTGFYYNIFHAPFNSLTDFLNTIEQKTKIERDDAAIVMGYLHRKDIKKRSGLKGLSKGSDKILASYIRLFEPMVIKSLKQYTVTSDVKLQAKVLQLLSQLVQLRVNYCLLDSEQIFIGFVLKQFEFIEGGYIPLTEALIPKIFNFLVHLSYGKQHSKSIISVPKIIQLCDGLMASGQSPATHCIPALKPIVLDIFLTRNQNNTGAEFKELETTREVLLSMLLRLVEYYKVMELLSLIVNESRYCNDNEDRWIRWSRQIADSVFPLLAQCKIRLETRDAQIALQRLLILLHSSVYKQVGDVLKIVFQEPPSSTNSQATLSNWLGTVSTLLLTISHAKEDLLLLKITEYESDFSPKSVFNNISATPDPLNVVNVTHCLTGIDPEIIFARFIFRVIRIISESCVLLARNEGSQFLVEQFSSFLMYILHIFQSGSHCKVAITAGRLIASCDDINVRQINGTIFELAPFYPTLVCQWCYLMTLLNYNDQKFWAQVMFTSEQGDAESTNLNTNIVQCGSTIVFCDYMCENFKENEQLCWLLNNHIKLLINMSNEAPISELFAAIHRDRSGSNLVIESIKQNCKEIFDPTFKGKVLKCIENAHPSQSGAILQLLIPKMLRCRYLAITRQATNIASRKTEILLTLNAEEVKKQLAKEDLLKILNILSETQLSKKHETLTSLLNKLAVQCYDLSPLEMDQKLQVNADEIRSIAIDKSWYLSQVRSRCWQPSYLGPESAQLLSKLDLDDLMPIMTNAKFNKLILRDCILLGRNMMQTDATTEPPLFEAAVAALLEHVVYVVGLIPKPHQVYNINGLEMSPAEEAYTEQMTKLFHDHTFWNLLQNVIPSVICYVESLPYCPNMKIAHNHMEHFVRFAVVCIESLCCSCSSSSSDTDHSSRNCLEKTLKCASVILKQSNLCTVFAADSRNTWLCSSVNSVHRLVQQLLLTSEPLPFVPNSGLAASLEDPSTNRAARACDQLAVLVGWFERILNEDECCCAKDAQDVCFAHVKSIVVALCRLPLVNSYVLTPPNAWAHGFAVDLVGPFNTVVPPLPIEFLQEIDILEQLIFRITLLGWTSRQQFEEIWMCLLSVFNSTDNINEDNVPEELMAQATSQAVQAITGLLLQSLLHPNPGNPNTSNMLHVPRDAAINESSVSVKKLKNVQNALTLKYDDYIRRINNGTTIRNVFNKNNVEKSNVENYSYGQLSIEYLWLAAKIVEEMKESLAAAEFVRHNAALLESGLDINSCLHFLIDLYTRWIKSQAKIPTRLLHEILKSTIIISDLFTEKSQFQWMFDTCSDLSKTHPPEDEILQQYVVIGICKAAAVLTPDIDVYESVKKLIIHSLKSAFIPSRIAALHGLLYLLQSCILSNTVIGGQNDETQLLYLIAVDYVRVHLNSVQSANIQNQDYHSILWALAFFILENIKLDEKSDGEFSKLVLQNAITLLSQQNIPLQFHNSLIKGLERLIIKKSFKDKAFQQILKVSLDNLKNANLNTTVTSLQLVLSCMYTDHEKQLEEAEKLNGIVQNDPDNLVKAIEKLSAIFDRIKRGYPAEVEMLCSVLPHVLNDFFPPSEILTKVIGEFLSPQQPHPKLLSGVVFSVFERACAESQLPLLQDWVVFSLSNFTQSLPVGMSTWCLTCFFISASNNQWLRNIFPHVQSRMGRYVYEDRKMLCIAGTDFYRNLTAEAQRKAFVETFEKVKQQPGMPFNDLVLALTRS